MKRIRLIEETMLYEVIKDMYVGLQNILPVNIGLVIIILCVLALMNSLYITGAVLLINPISLYHVYNLLKRV